jgi:multisubunit Na+/H+ antiporter MnhB subunit
MIRLTAFVAVALPVIMVAWTVVGMFAPDLGMQDGHG